MSERLGRLLAASGWAGAVLVLLALPLYVDGFWLSAGLVTMAAAVGAVGLTLLVGAAGQLSFAHAFFLAVGAYGYACFSGRSPADSAGTAGVGLGLPPVLGAVLAIAVAGVFGLMFSPVASRLRGIYLGVASLSLVFGGQHLLQNLTSVTGGFNGRGTPAFTVAGFDFTGTDPALTVAGVPFTATERLWYLGLAALAAACLVARNLLRGRTGRALRMIRDSEVAAAVLGVDVRRGKVTAFVASSMFAGAAGVLSALALDRVVPDYFGLLLSIEFLAMIVIGGLGSVGGAVTGAVFVTMLPIVLARYSDVLPLVAGAGSGGVDAAVLARFCYGAAVVLVIGVQPDGLAGLGRRLRFPLRPAAFLAAPQPPRSGSDTPRAGASTGEPISQEIP
ncbi:MAG: branched-chain amino acid transporter permease [Dactylosporangium sp.]|nr:branched-chain amino acid transporter permease [Dactylosporangium sp.]